MTTRQRFNRILIASLVALAAPFSLAQDFIWAPGITVGSEIPAIEAPDQNGEIRTFDDLVGETGLLLMFSRSFDW
jgi:hypothetical protein